MKKQVNLFIFITLILVSLSFSCKKQNQEQPEGQLELNFSLSSLKSSNSDTLFPSTVASVIVSIEDTNGKKIKTREKIDISDINRTYKGQLKLPVGNYKLTEFMVIDWKNAVVYVVPMAGSNKASLVSNLLPVQFTIKNGNVSKLIPEVLNAASCSPDDFGYDSFAFDAAETFDFKLGTFVYNDTFKNYKLTSSSISIYNQSTPLYAGQTSTTNLILNLYDNLGINNTITLPEKFNLFKVVVSKPGYQTFTNTYSKEELKLHGRSKDKGPLVITLEKSPVPTTVMDVDNNVYHTLTIGTQVWLLENLKSIHYRNGDPITHVEDASTWWAQTTEAYCEYGDPSVYGRLYNWYAVMDSRNICPIGYHIPSNAEWQTLVDYLGGLDVAAGKLKEAGTNHWYTPNTGASNSSGFAALPAGYRHGGSSDPYYNYKANLTWSAVFWTSTPNSSNDRVYTWLLNYSQENIQNPDNSYKGTGLSIRCIKD